MCFVLHDCGREVNTARCYFKGKQDCQWPLLQGCQHTAHFDLRWSGPVKLRFCQCKEVTTTTVFLLDKEKAAVAKTEIHQHNSGLTWFSFLVWYCKYLFQHYEFCGGCLGAHSY